MTKADTVESVELSIPEASKLPAIFREGRIDEIISRIEKDALAIAPDLSTSKGRKEIASLAHKVARSKTALDNAGKELTEAARKEIDAVNAERKKARDRLDALKVTVRKPLEDWEDAEEKRKAGHRERLQAFSQSRTDWTSSSEDIEAVIAEVKSTAIDESWEEFAVIAEEAKETALAKLQSDLTAAQNREAQERELEEIKAAREKELAERREEKLLREQKELEEQKARDKAEKARKKDEDARAEQKRLATSTIDYIKEVQSGMIGGQPQPYGILLYELKERIQIDDRMGDHQESVAAVRDAAISALEIAQADNARRREEAEKLAKRTAEEAAIAKAKEEEEARRLAEQKEREKRESNKRHRAKVMKEISAAIKEKSTGEIVDALVAGEVPHVTVQF